MVWRQAVFRCWHDLSAGLAAHLGKLPFVVSGVGLGRDVEA